MREMNRRGLLALLAGAAVAPLAAKAEALQIGTSGVDLAANGALDRTVLTWINGMDGTVTGWKVYMHGMNQGVYYFDTLNVLRGQSLSLHTVRDGDELRVRAVVTEVADGGDTLRVLSVHEPSAA